MLYFILKSYFKISQIIYLHIFDNRLLIYHFRFEMPNRDDIWLIDFSHDALFLLFFLILILDLIAYFCVECLHFNHFLHFSSSLIYLIIKLIFIIYNIIITLYIQNKYMSSSSCRKL